MLYPCLTLSRLDIQSCNAAWNYCYRTSVQLPGGADSVPVGLGLACIDFLPLSLATKITMSSPSDTIIITDDEELPSLEEVSSRLRRASRRDYSYRAFQAVNNEADTTPSRKRKSTETEPSTLNNAFEELRKEVSRISNKLQCLQDE